MISDTRWEDLDLELPTERLDRAELPENAPVPDWVRRPPPSARDARSRAGLAEGALVRCPLALAGCVAAVSTARTSSRCAGGRSAPCASTTLCSPVAPGQPGVRCAPCAASAQTYGGDITIAPFLDQPSFAGAEHAPASTASREDRAVARLQRHGLQRSERVLLSDPRFFPFARRLGLADRAAFVPFVLDTGKVRARPAA